MNTEELKSLKEMFWGAQDEKLKNMDKNKQRLFYDNIIEHKKVEYIHNNIQDKYDIICISYEPNLGVANVKITGDWQQLDLEVGGMRLDRIYRVSEENSFDIFNKGSCMPTLEHHNVIKLISKGTNYTVEYDLVSVNNNIPVNTYPAYFIKQQVYDNHDNLIIGTHKFPVWFNHPTEKLTVYSDEPIEDVVLAIAFDLKINFTQISPLKWEINFGEEYAPNFSRMDCAKIYFKNNFENNQVHFWGTSHAIIKYGAGMCGLAFAK